MLQCSDQASPTLFAWSQRLGGKDVSFSLSLRRVSKRGGGRALFGMKLPVTPMRRFEHYFTAGSPVERLPYVKDVARLACRSEGQAFSGGWSTAASGAASSSTSITVITGRFTRPGRG
jgi:hypothetical protein